MFKFNTYLRDFQLKQDKRRDTACTIQTKYDMLASTAPCLLLLVRLSPTNTTIKNRLAHRVTIALSFRQQHLQSVRLVPARRHLFFHENFQTCLTTVFVCRRIHLSRPCVMLSLSRHVILASAKSAPSHHENQAPGTVLLRCELNTNQERTERWHVAVIVQ